MQQSHEIKTVLDRVVVPNLLISAVTLIDRVMKHGDLERNVGMLTDFNSFGKGRVTRPVVDNKNFNLVGSRPDLKVCGAPPSE